MAEYSVYKAGYKMAWCNLFQFWFLLAALIGGMRAAIGKPAGIGRIDGRGDLPLQKEPLLFAVDPGDGDSTEQGLGIGMCGMGKELLGRSFFHQTPQVHHHDVV